MDELPAAACDRRCAAAAAALVVALTGLRLLYMLPLNALPDEAYHFVWSRHLAFGYYDQPPLLTWSLALFYWLTGSKILAVRLVPALLDAWSSYYVFRLGRELGGGQTAFWSVAVMHVTPLFTAGAMLATPDAPMVSFLCGATHYLHRALTREKTGAWLLAGLFAGLALLSKYTAVLFFPSVLLYLWFGRDRRCLTRKEPWLACALAALLFSPVVIWNASHEWVSFAFQWTHGFDTREFPQWRHLVDYLGSEAAVVGPVLLGLLLGALLSVARAWDEQSSCRRLLWWLAVVPMLFFLCSSLFQKVEANWPCFAYVPGILLVVDVYRDRLMQPGRVRAWWRLHWVVSAIVLAAVLLHIYVPFLPVRKDRAADFFGWDALGASAVSLAREYPDLPLAANRYQLAAELEFYSGLAVTCLNIRGRPNQYDLWQDAGAMTGGRYLFFGEGPAEDHPVVRRSAFSRRVRTLALRGRGERVVREIFVYEVVLCR